MLTVLGEPMRVTLLERLIDAPASATELARALPVTRSAVSQHLQLLKAAGLVDDTPAGTSRVYAVDPDALALLRSYFETFWSRSLDGFRRAAEATAAARPAHARPASGSRPPTAHQEGR